MNLPRLRSTLIISVAVSIICIASIGCDALMPSAAPPAPTPKATPAAVKPPAGSDTQTATSEPISTPEPSPASRYYYDPTNKPDPFEPFKFEEEVLSEEEMITRYEVRFFRLVGIISGVHEPKALFEDPLGNAYVLTIGDIIGKNGGVVTSITPEEVNITETRVTILGDTRTSDILVQLHPEEEQTL